MHDLEVISEASCDPVGTSAGDRGSSDVQGALSGGQ